jgi:histidyl-tRNA synthetase
MLFGGRFIALGYEEAIVPALWSQQTFERKAATPELMSQMWLFKDRKERDVCLIPEATALFQELVQSKIIRGERRLFYIARCYRYERPQAGRYREFTQLGAEILNPRSGSAAAVAQARSDCEAALLSIGIDPASLAWNGAAKRGLGYYLNGEGFEARCDKLGAQSQLVGGGAYDEGAGFAIGLDRALLAMGQPVDS